MNIDTITLTVEMITSVPADTTDEKAKEIIEGHPMLPKAPEGMIQLESHLTATDEGVMTGVEGTEIRVFRVDASIICIRKEVLESIKNMPNFLITQMLNDRLCN